MPISRSAAVRRGFAAKARCSAWANEIDRGALSAASTGIVTTSNAHVRRKATPSQYIDSTGKAERQRGGSAARSYDFQVNVSVVACQVRDGLRARTSARRTTV